MLCKQKYWWWLINLFFAPLILITQTLLLPAWLYLTVFLLLIVVFWGTVKGDVPLFLSSAAVVDAVQQLLAREQADNMLELGAGIGTLIVPLAKRLPFLQITAIEIAPLPWLISYFRCRRLHNVELHRANFWQCDLTNYTVVFAFLSPLVMAKIAEKIHNNMHEGSLFISSSFAIPEWTPESIIEINDAQHTVLFCYRIQRGELV